MSLFALHNLTVPSQTMGKQFEADGRIRGELKLETVQCDQASNTCQVRVPAPGFALVLMNDDAVAEATRYQNTETFATSAVTKLKNTATIDEAVLATSNGNRGMENMKGSTSFGSAHGYNAAPARAILPSVVALLAMAAGAGVAMRAFWR